MTVTPHDLGTFLVESQSGREPHLVDLAYVGEGRRKPQVACGCESNFIHGRMCPHIKAAIEFAFKLVSHVPVHGSVSVAISQCHNQSNKVDTRTAVTPAIGFTISL